MSVGRITTIERSDTHIAELISERQAVKHTALTTNELLGRLALPTVATKDEKTGLLVIAGGAASGKSTLAKTMQELLAQQEVKTAIISSDDYVRGDRGMRRTWEASGEGPDAKYDFGYMRAIIRAVCANRDPERHVVAPKYDATTGKALASDRRRYIPPVDMLIIEGDMLGEHGVAPDALYPDDLDLDAKTLYLHLPDTERLAYRVNRDMEHRNGHGETPEIIADNFESRQLKQHLPYTLGYAAAADCIVQPVNLAPDLGRHYDVWQMQSAAIAAQ